MSLKPFTSSKHWKLTSSPPINRGLLLNNRTWFEFLLGGKDLGKDLARLLAASEEAIRIMQSAAADVPPAFLRESLAVCFDTLSCVLLALGRHADVIERLRAHETAGGTLTPSAMLALGDAYQGVGDQESAKAMWRRVVEVARPGPEEATRARQRIGS